MNDVGYPGRKVSTSVDGSPEPLADGGNWFSWPLLWFVPFPVLPLLFSMAALAFIVEPASDATTPLVRTLLGIDIEFISAQIRTLTHLSSVLNYLSVGSVHAIVCLVAVAFFVGAMMRMPAATIRRTGLYMLVSVIALLAIAVGLVVLANDSMLTQLGYKSVCMLLSMADLQTAIVWRDPGTLDGHTGLACFAPRMTRLVLMAYVPVGFGVAVIWIASALNTVMAGEPMPTDDACWRIELLRRVGLLRKSLFISSLVLVTSTIAIFQFTSLPLELLADKAQKAALTGFVNGLASFWGGLFTATLLASLAPAAWLLLLQALRHLRSQSPHADLGSWLHETVFVSISKQLMNVLVVIAPMLVGPLGHLLQSLPGQ